MSDPEAASEVMRSMTQVGGTTGVEVLSARDVPLGGPRALRVRRTIPRRARTPIGAWCFADHYGPVEVPAGGMDLPPHPHTALQTVSRRFSGTIEHRDSLGTHSLIRPGELNLMTGGHGIAHSEVSTADTTVLHGVQLRVALPDADREAGRDFQHHVPEPVRIDGAELRVFLGSVAGETSPVRTFTPLLGAQLDLEPHATVTLSIDPGFEHGLLVSPSSCLRPNPPHAPPAPMMPPRPVRPPAPDARCGGRRRAAPPRRSASSGSERRGIDRRRRRHLTLLPEHSVECPRDFDFAR